MHLLVEWREILLREKKHEVCDPGKSKRNKRKNSVWKFLKAQLFNFQDEYYHFPRLIILTANGSSTLS